MPVRPSPVASSAPNNFTKKASRGTLAAALDSGSGKGTTSFPENLVEIDHWMAFRINKSELMKKADFPVTSDIHRVFLPLPIQFQTSYQQNYSSANLGPLGNAAAAAGKGIKSLTEDFDGAIAKLKNKFTSLDGYKSMGKGAADTAVAVGINTAVSVASALPGVGDAAKGLIAGAGIAVNPYLAMIYESPSLRSHQFSWKLVAKNYRESLAIYQITKLFKYHSAPEIPTTTGLGALLKYPEQFDVDVHNDDFLYNIGPSIMTNLTVDYHPDGILYHTQGPDAIVSEVQKLPVAVNLSLTLQEVSIITKKEILEQDR